MYYILVFLSIITAVAGTYLRIEDDIVISERLWKELYHNKRRLGAGDEDFITLWRNNYTNGKFVIPVAFREDHADEGTNTMTQGEAESIMAALSLMETKLGNVIEFVNITGSTPDHYISIGNFGGGCWSYVGQQDVSFQPQAMNIGTSCIFTDTIEHEMMHALGFFHEQARPDRDDHIVVNWDNIETGKYVNFQKSFEINPNGSPYDYQSIMHYSSFAFAVNRSIPTITTTDGRTNVGQSTTMTPTDIEQIRAFYRCFDGVRSIDSNCDSSCPCFHNEGNCTNDDGCEGFLVCNGDNKCVDTGATLAPTTSPPPTSSPPPTTSPPPTSSPPSPAPSSVFDDATIETILMYVGVPIVAIAIFVLVVHV